MDFDLIHICYYTFYFKLKTQILEFIKMLIQPNSDYLNPSMHYLKIKLLGVLRMLAMEHATRIYMQNAGAIPVLIALMVTRDFESIALLALLDLTWLSPKRLELAAVSGIVPHLIEVYNKQNVSLLTPAIQILCPMAHTSDKTRDILWQCGALSYVHHHQIVAF